MGKCRQSFDRYLLTHTVGCSVEKVLEGAWGRDGEGKRMGEPEKLGKGLSTFLFEKRKKREKRYPHTTPESPEPEWGKKKTKGSGSLRLG
jgi:hypothetical protein